MKITPEQEKRVNKILGEPDIAKPNEVAAAIKWQAEIGTRVSSCNWDGTLDEIADAVHANAIAHGFHPKDQSDDDFIDKQLNNLHDEISELHLAWRAGQFAALCDKSEAMQRLSLPALTNAEEEYADIIIRVLDQCRHLKIDIARAVALKHLYNITRPYRHGNKLS